MTNQYEETPKEIEIKQTTNNIVAMALAFQIQTAEHAEQAADLLSTLKDGFNNAEAERKEIVKPFNDGVSAINARFKKITQPIQEAINSLKQQVLAYDNAQQKIRDEEALKLATKLEEQGNEVGADIAMKTAQIKPAAIQSNSGNTAQIRMTWDFEVVDVKAFAAAHPEMVTINAVAVRSLIRSGVRDLAGLRIVQVKSVASR